MRKIIVTGCGRSGTGYMAEVLRRCGLKVGHEKVFRPGIRKVDWGEFDGDASWIAVPWLSTLIDRPVILHQLRNPIECARSHIGIRFFHDPCLHYNEAFWGIVRGYAPGVFTGFFPITRFMLYWVAWNRGVEPYADLRYRVEDVDADFLCRLLTEFGAEVNEEKIAKAITTSTLTNHRERDELLTVDTLPDVKPREPFLKLACEYGYNLDSVEVSSSVNGEDKV